MKRVIAVSDSHGDIEGLRLAFAQAASHGKIDVAVFLGDGLADFEAVRPWLTQRGTICYCVRGNNDWCSPEPREQCFLVNGVRFYLSHGHQWQVKFGPDRLWYAARECGAQVALYGHTHRERVDLERDVYLINPGSVCERRGGRSAYAEIQVEDNGYLRPSLRLWER